MSRFFRKRGETSVQHWNRIRQMKGGNYTKRQLETDYKKLGAFKATGDREDEPTFSRRCFLLLVYAAQLILTLIIMWMAYKVLLVNEYPKPADYPTPQSSTY